MTVGLPGTHNLQWLACLDGLAPTRPSSGLVIICTSGC